MLLRFLLKMSVLLSLISCQNGRNAAKSDPYDASSLKGTWVIEKTVCCGRAQVVTFGGTKELTIRDKKNTYTIREQGKVIERGEYRIDLKSQFGPVLLLGEQLPAMYSVENGRLWLNWGYMDLQEETYIKKK